MKRYLPLDPASLLTPPRFCLGAERTLTLYCHRRGLSMFHERLVQGSACRSRTARNWPAELCPITAPRRTPSFSQQGFLAFSSDQATRSAAAGRQSTFCKMIHPQTPNQALGGKAFFFIDFIEFLSLFPS